MVVSATELAAESKSIIDRVIQGGETVEVQRHGRTVAIIQPRVGVNRAEFVRLLRGRGFTAVDSKEMQTAMDTVSTQALYPTSTKFSLWASGSDLRVLPRFT